MGSDELTNLPAFRHPGSAGRAAETILYAGIVVTGIATTLLGPLLPILMARWSLTDERGGAFFIAQFTASLAGIALLDPLVSRRGYGVALAAGFASIALGLAGLALAPEAAALLGAAVMGFGLGLTLSGANLWVAEAARHRRAAALSILNLAWGIGATASAPLVMLARRSGRLPLFLFTMAVCALLASLGVGTAISAAAASPPSPQAPQQLWTASPATFVLGAIFFLYVGTENSLGGWTAALARREGVSSGNPWELAPLFFWASLLTGRAVTPLALRRLPERILLRAGIAVAAMGSMLFLNAASFQAIAACAALTGFGMAAIYPLLISMMASHYGDQARRAGRLMFALATLGGAALPWLVGFTSTHAQSLRWGFLVPAGASLAMIGLLANLPDPSAASS